MSFCVKYIYFVQANLVCQFNGDIYIIDYNIFQDVSHFSTVQMHCISEERCEVRAAGACRKCPVQVLVWLIMWSDGSGV
jgi:hypothetical protein